MVIVLLTALMVGGATIFGTLLGLLFSGISHRFSNITLAFAAGIMLSASILGLILPAVEHGGTLGIFYAVTGIFTGAFCVSFSSLLIPWLHRLMGIHTQTALQSEKINKVLLFLAAIAIHNLPEGLAAGVTFGTGNIREAILIAAGIAVQNIPEGLITVAPLLAAGIPSSKAVWCGIVTGLIEIAGTLLGYWAISAMAALLPFALAFAGGTMLYVICNEMIPEVQSGRAPSLSTYALLVGFTLMMISDLLLQ